MTDEDLLPELVARARAGDQDAWAELVRSVGPRVFALLLARTRDPELAEELTARCFARLVEALDAEPGRGGYTESGRFVGFLFRVAMNQLRDDARAKSRFSRRFAGAGERVDAAEVADPGPGVHEEMERRERAEALRAALDALPEADREVLHLHHAAQLTYAQIAELLGQPRGTVLARGHRATRKLAKLLAPAHTP